MVRLKGHSLMKLENGASTEITKLSVERESGMFAKATIAVRVDNIASGQILRFSDEDARILADELRRVLAGG